MKTKVNKVPLVGPRGRRELLDRIEELEKKVSELESEADNIKILTIPNYVGANIEGIGKADFCNKAGISVQQFDKLLLGEYTFLKFPNYDPEPEKPYFYNKYRNNKMYFYRFELEDPDAQNGLVAFAELTIDSNSDLIVFAEY